MQDLAQGKSLAELVKSGWRADEEEVTRIAKELLNILDYLATRRPAVTHRSTPATTSLSSIILSHNHLKSPSTVSDRRAVLCLKRTADMTMQQLVCICKIAALQR